MIRNLRSVRFRTIESNYFKKPLSLNLLTWAAKEQIQYLHDKDPQTWTTQTLSELYPVSEQDIKGVMKSKVRLFREKDVLEHDLTVQRNWANLKATLEGDGDSATDLVCQTFMNSDNEIIIENAAGVRNLPFPVKRIERFNPKGFFSAIVNDCYMAKDEARRQAEEELRHQSEQLCAMLSEVSKIFDVRSKKRTSNSRIHSLKAASEMVVSGTSYSKRMSAEESIEVSDNTKKERNDQENTEEFISSKYKDSPCKNQSYDSENRKRDVPHKLKVPQDQLSAGGTFVSGDCVYDKNGEFLYRIL